MLLLLLPALFAGCEGDTCHESQNGSKGQRVRRPDPKQEPCHQPGQCQRPQNPCRSTDADKRQTLT